MKHSFFGTCQVSGPAIWKWPWKGAGRALKLSVVLLIQGRGGTQAYLCLVRGWRCSCHSPCPLSLWPWALAASSRWWGCVLKRWGGVCWGSIGWRTGSSLWAQPWHFSWWWDLGRTRTKSMFVFGRVVGCYQGVEWGSPDSALWSTHTASRKLSLIALSGALVSFPLGSEALMWYLST